MKTLQLLFLGLSTVLLSSCEFDLRLGQTNGNGNVVTEERSVDADFNIIRGSAGLDVFVKQGDAVSITVEADENLHDLIETEVINGTLKIGTTENIGRAKAKKIYVTFTELSGLEASSGADVIAESVLKAETVTLDASSGADLEAEVFTKRLIAETSSGADLKVWGQASNLEASASSGSDLDAEALEVISCIADASSGADIKVNVRDRLEADTSSGGDVHYRGNPKQISKNDSHSGGVHKM
ncbi:head GIN domain-containing protein [Luteirhabdus pelagi]|uniref:head GIN domain-containing protein n=1 Tax=Luteirhabdus pelagi TaxID=2792783 RepID=UPI001939FFCD|nr:head GIN domain-containing protein [Luteirhabdus pelagi]